MHSCHFKARYASWQILDEPFPFFPFFARVCAFFFSNYSWSPDISDLEMWSLEFDHSCIFGKSSLNGWADIVRQVWGRQKKFQKRLIIQNIHLNSCPQFCESSSIGALNLGEKFQQSQKIRFYRGSPKFPWQQQHLCMVLTNIYFQLMSTYDYVNIPLVVLRWRRLTSHIFL